MNKITYTSLDYDWLFKPTGDPFANAGGYALKVFAETFPNDDILQLIKRATDIYVDKWNSNLYFFFPNSNITQTNQKFSDKNYKKEQAIKGFQNILNCVNAANGVCRITGRKTKVFVAGKHNYVLAGSKSMVNFHHGFEDGMMVSAEMLIRLFFLPFAVKTVNGFNCVIGSNSSMVEEQIAKSNCEKNFVELSHGTSQCALKSKSNDPSTELFRIADDILQVYSDDDKISLQLYRFKNAARATEFEKYTLPFEGMDFYRFVNRVKYKDDWKRFVTTKYFVYNTKKKKRDFVSDVENVVEDEYKYWKNLVYENLIKGESILPDIRKWSESNKFNFDIVKVYEIKVRKMKKETIQKIDQKADFIFEANDKFGIEKAIKKLYAVVNSYDLRRFVLKDIVARYYEKHSEEQQAIITVEDYTNYLFPDTDSWKETRDVLIIALFQKLHERKIEIEIEDNQETNNIE